MQVATPRHDNDCVATVLASLLELPIDDVPDFWASSGSAVSQYKAVRKWLALRGYHYYYSTIQPRQLAKFRTEKIDSASSWPPRGYWIGQVARVEWLRDNEPSHVVVMKNQRCVLNPNGTLKVVEEDDVWLTGYYLLVPLDPAGSGSHSERPRPRAPAQAGVG